MAAHIQGEVIRGQYSDTLSVGPPDRREPVRAVVHMLTRAELKKQKFPRATNEEFAQVVEGADFPRAGKRTAFGGQITLIWSEGLIDRWIADKRAEAETILRVTG